MIHVLKSPLTEEKQKDLHTELARLYEKGLISRANLEDHIKKWGEQT